MGRYREQWVGRIFSHGGVHRVMHRTYATGVDIKLVRPGSKDDERIVRVSLNPEDARRLAQSLIEGADQADRLNQR